MQNFYMKILENAYSLDLKNMLNLPMNLFFKKVKSACQVLKICIVVQKWNLKKVKLCDLSSRTKMA